MWSLPDINQMNARKAASQSQLKRQLRLKKSKAHPCDNCNEPSTVHLPYYDIFSEDISGVSHACEDCYQRGILDEDMFTCEVCERRMLDHITWERYQVNIGGVCMCLTCAAKAYFGTEENMIEPRAITSVIQDRVAFERDHQSLINGNVINICGVKHVLGVKQPLPEGIRYVDNFENCNGYGRFDCEEILARIKEQTTPCFLVLDGAYQFSQSIGLYVRD